MMNIATKNIIAYFSINLSSTFYGFYYGISANYFLYLFN